jgi:hypothetical protein
MPWPYGLSLVNLTGTFTDASGEPLAGNVVFTPVAVLPGTTTPQPVTVADPSGHVVIGGQGVTMSLQPRPRRGRGRASSGRRSRSPWRWRPSTTPG